MNRRREGVERGARNYRDPSRENPYLSVLPDYDRMEADVHGGEVRSGMGVPWGGYLPAFTNEGTPSLHRPGDQRRDVAGYRRGDRR